MKKVFAVFLALIVCAGLLSACGKDEDPGTQSGDEPSDAAVSAPESSEVTPESSEAAPESSEAAPESSEAAPESSEAASQPGKYQISQDEIKTYAHTWVSTERSEGKETVYRMILGEDGTAQLVVQNGIGDLLGLSVGTWSASGAQRLSIDLTTTMANGEELAEGKTFSTGGVYSAAAGELGNCLTLGAENGASPLTPAQKRGAVTFYDERFTPEKAELACNAALNYYAAQNGEPYPGKAVIEEYGQDGIVVRLREDAGGHVTTGGLYTIDPISLEGTDEILGIAIDFSDYAYAGTSAS